MTEFKYIIIASELRTMIIKEVYKKKLPSELELAKQFNVSRLTVRKAISILKQEELIYSIRGSGIYVNTLKKGILISNYQKQNKGFMSEHEGLEYETIVLDFKIIKCPLNVASFLNMRTDNSVYYIKRLRIIDGLPNRYEETYINHQLIPNLTLDICKYSIYNYINSLENLKICKTHDYFFATQCSKQDQEYLNLDSQQIVINLEQVGFLNSGEKFQYSVTKYRYDCFSYKHITKFR